MPEIVARTRTRTAPPAQTPAAAKVAAKPKPSRAVVPFMKASVGATVRPNTTGLDTNEAFRTEGRKQAMIEALQEFLGVVHYACLKTGVNRSTHYWWMQHDPDYAKEVGEVSGVALDFVEGQLLTNIRNGDATSAIFYLKTKGKARGYIERTEVTGADGGAINVHMSVEQVKEDLPLKALQEVLLKTVFKDQSHLVPQVKHVPIPQLTNG